MSYSIEGKLGGARGITCIYIYAAAETVCQLSIYDTSEKENLAEGELEVLRSELGTDQ